MLHRPAALVTGASSGIGEALARRFAGAGFRPVLVARREDRLRALADALSREHGADALAVPADLARRGEPARIAARLARARVAVDVLVNNAGILRQGAFASDDVEAQLRMLDLNVVASTAMLAAFLPAMVRRGRGRVLNVASIASFAPVPGLAVYAATKAYVLSLSESLALELAGSGITVTALCPGVTATEMLDGATARNARLAGLPRALVGDVGRVADEGFRACMAGDAIAIPGLANRAAIAAGRALPRALLRRIAGAVVQPMLPSRGKAR